MPKFSYDTILNSVEDSCALTQPLVSPRPDIVPQTRPVTTTTQEVVETPTTAVSGSSIQVEDVQVTGEQLTGNITIDLTPYQQALESLNFTETKDGDIASTITSTKVKPSLDSQIGIDALGNTTFTDNAAGSVLLNSDRIVINSKQQLSMMLGQKGVAIASPGKVNIDAGESITLAAYGDGDGGLFLGVPNKGIQYTTAKQTQIGLSKGSPTADQPYEPLVLGIKLANLLQDFLFVLKSAQGVDALSPVKFQPDVQAEFALLANRIPEILSNYGYVDGMSHGSVDMDQLAAIESARATVPDYVPPANLTGSISGQFTVAPGSADGTGGGLEFGGPGLEPIKNLIASGESFGGDYDVYNFNTPERSSGSGGIRTSNPASGAKAFYSSNAVKLTQQTVAQIIALQSSFNTDSSGKKFKLFAVGKYQTIPGTLKAAATALGLLNSLFDQTTQEKIGDRLVLTARPRLGSYLKGTNEGSITDLEKAVQDLGQEFASFPIITKNGTKYGDVATGTGNKAYYGGQGPNPDSVKKTVGDVVKMLIKSRIQFSSKQPSFIPTYYTP